MIVTRRNKPSWEFIYDEEYDGFVYKTKKNIYKIFIDNWVSDYYNLVDIWIGRYSELETHNCWFTCEKDIGAESILMFRGQYNFR